MNRAFLSREHIQASPERVWAVLTDWSRAPEWMSSVTSVEPADGSGQGVGAVLRFGARGKVAESTVEAWEVGRSLCLTSKQGGVTASYLYELEPHRGGTNMVLEVSCTAQGLVWRLLSPVIRLAMRWTDGRQLEELKRVVAGGDR